MRIQLCGRLALVCACVLLPAVMSAGEGTGDSLTVEDVVRLVLEQHPAIMQAAGTVDAADARVKLAESAWNPNVQVEASYTRLAPIAQLQFGPEEFRLFPADNFDAHIGLRQQLYDFGRTSAATELSRSRGQAARIGVNTARVSLAYQSIQTFYVILYLRAAIGVQQDQIRVLEEHRDVTQKKVTSGTATDFDVLTTEVRLGTARNQKIDLENAGHKAEVALARLIGREGDDPLLLTGSFEHVSAGLSADTLLHEAMAQRQEILAARSDQESARLQLQVAGLSERPSLNLGVSYGFKNGYMPNLDALRGNLAASVRIEVPVFEGGRGDLREEEAGAQVRSAEAHLTDTRMQIAQEVRQALSDLRSAVGKLSASELQLSQARQALTIARKRYEIGAISNLDLLDTESSLQQSNLLWLQSLYAVTANRFALSRAVGKEPWSHEGPK